MLSLLALAGSFGFQGVNLGMTEAALRQVVPTLGCTDGTLVIIPLSAEERAAGAKICAPTQVIGSTVLPDDVSVGDYRGAVRYHVAQGVVARIEFWPDLPATDAVLAGLTARFGKPKELKHGTWKSVGGQTVPSIEATWQQGDERIDLRSPSSNINKMTVTYSNGIQTERVVPAKM